MTVEVLQATHGANRSGEVRRVEREPKPTTQEPPAAAPPKPEFHEPADMGAMHVYVIDNCADHFIAAPDIWSAVEFFKAWDGGCSEDNGGFEVQRLTQHRSERVAIFDEDSGERHSAAYWASTCKEPALIGCSEW